MEGVDVFNFNNIFRNLSCNFPNTDKSEQPHTSQPYIATGRTIHSNKCN